MGQDGYTCQNARQRLLAAVGEVFADRGAAAGQAPGPLAGGLRALGGSCGIAFATTLLERRQQFHQAILAEHAYPYNAIYREMIANATQMLVHQGSNLATAMQQAPGLIYQMIRRQAMMQSFVDNFWIMGVICLLTIPLMFLMRTWRESMMRGRDVVGRVALLGCLVLSGCLSQKKDIATYREVLDRSAPPVPASQPGETLSLQEALGLANQYNERIALSGEDYVQSLINRDRAISAFLPTFALGNTNTWQNPPIVNIPSNLAGAGAAGNALLSGLSSAFSAVIPPERIVDVPIQGQITVFNGFRNVSQLRQAGFDISRQRGVLLDLQATVLLDTATAFYAVIQAEASVEVLSNSIQVQEARVRDIRFKREAGLARALDVAQTEAQAAATRVQLINARNAVLNGRALLGLLVGTQLAVQSRLVDSLAVGEVPDLGILLQEAELGRQDLVAAKAAVQVAEQGIYQAFSEYLPSATFSAQYFLYRESIPSTSDWLRVLSVSMPIFSAGFIEENIRTAWSQARQAKLVESLTRRQINQQVQVAYDDLQASIKRGTELKIEVEAAAEALRQAETSFQAGLATNLDRIQAQDRLLISQLQQVNEYYNLKRTYLQLLRAIGQISTRLPGEPAGVPMTLPADVLQTSAATQPTTQPAPAPEDDGTTRQDSHDRDPVIAPTLPCPAGGLGTDRLGRETLAAAHGR